MGILDTLFSISTLNKPNRLDVKHGKGRPTQWSRCFYSTHL